MMIVALIPATVDTADPMHPPMGATGAPTAVMEALMVDMVEAVVVDGAVAMTDLPMELLVTLDGVPAETAQAAEANCVKSAGI